MIPAGFEYERAATVEGALSLLDKHGDEAKLIAGGHSLLPLMKLRLASPGVLVDIARIPGLGYVREDGGAIAIGALTRHCDLVESNLLRRRCPLVAQVAAEVGDIQVRHRGTIGGSLAHADPNADLPAAMVALDAELVAQGPGGRRTIAARDFFQGFLQTALRPDELLVEVRIAPTEGAATAYVKFSRRRQDWAIVGAAAVVRNGAETVVWTGVGSTPVRAEGGIEAAAAALSPSGDLSGSAAYKRHLAMVIAGRALAAARGAA